MLKGIDHTVLNYVLARNGVVLTQVILIWCSYGAIMIMLAESSLDVKSKAATIPQLTPLLKVIDANSLH